ncbi:MAG: parallel beta-helix domain-containing protein [Polyangiaceae bacterium]
MRKNKLGLGAASPLLLAGAAAILAPACDDTSGTGGNSTTSSSSGNSALECPTAPKIDGCTVAIAPSDKDYEHIQTAFGNAHAGDTICLCPGTFNMTREVSLGVQNVTVRGAGATLADTVLDYAKQDTADDGFAVTAGGFTVENLTLKNTPGNGIVATGVDGVTFRDLKVFWDAGSVTANGAYAVYPVKSKNVLIEHVEVVGAADAGVYVGQCEKAIVRNNDVHGCVAGIESENTTDMEIYDNDAYDNTAGILVFVLPGLEKKDGLRTNVHDNKIHDNNRANFAAKGSVVSYVPAGVGMLVLAADQPEIHGNTIENNESLGITVVSGNTLALLNGKPWSDPMTDLYPTDVFIHDNTFTNNGTKPHGALMAFTTPVESIVFDGEEMSPGSAKLCLGAMGPYPTFRNTLGSENIGNPSMNSTDTTPFQCDGTKLMPVVLDAP